MEPRKKDVSRTTLAPVGQMLRLIQDSIESMNSGLERHPILGELISESGVDSSGLEFRTCTPDNAPRQITGERLIANGVLDSIARNPFSCCCFVKDDSGL